MYDIDRHRENLIRFNGLTKANNTYTLYHDETNNTIKLRVTERGFNVAQLKVFVLGGIVHEGEPQPLDIANLRQSMRIQASAPEIKLEHVAKGSFLDVLRSERLTAFLEWVTNNGLMIHYQTLDPLYWSIVDILDSILYRLGNPVLIAHHAILKSDLTLVLRADLARLTALFHRYNYPNLNEDSRRPFIDELLEMLECGSSMLPAFNFMMLKGTLQAARRLTDLVFIEKNTSHELIDNFSTFYMTRIALFKYSTHVLDMEESIRGHFQETPLVCQGQPVMNYRFADSKAEIGIQLSDVVVGLLGKMYTYFTETEPELVAAARADLSGTALANAELLRKLINTSDESNVAFLNHVASQHDIAKLNLFLRFADDSDA